MYVTNIAARKNKISDALVYYNMPAKTFHYRWFMSPHHVGPEEAIQIHKDIKSRRSLGIHWGTFKLTNEVIVRFIYKPLNIINIAV